MLLLHGALGSKQQTDPLRSELDHVGAYNFNFSGHGGNAIPDAFTTTLFAEDVLRFMDANNINSTAIFGYSMGGYVALHLAQNYPDRVEKIITLGTKFDWTPETAAQEVRMLNPAKIEEKVPAFAAHLAQVHSPEDWKVVMARTADMMLQLGGGARLTDQDLNAVQQPVLICRGALDKMVSKEESQSAAAALPNGSFLEIDGFKHPFEQIDVVRLAQIIQDWG